MVTTFKNFTTEETKDWLTENNVLFVTNTPAMPGSVFVSSMRTYIDYIPIHNFHIIPGIANSKPFYGLDAYLDLIGKCISDSHFKKFDYVIYIDEDAFITDFSLMMDDFLRFKDGNYCLAGPQDGLVICHRNHQHMMINTFISFWNMKLLRESATPNDIKNMLNTINGNKRTPFENFDNILKQNNSLYYAVKNSADENAELVKAFRNSLFTNGESEYCKTVRNDPTNPVEPHQTPYTTSYGKEVINYEPYYLVEQMMILLTKRPIYYMFATDYYNPNLSDDETDNSGLSSAVYDRDTKEMYCVHTWFSRGYSKWPRNKVMLHHTQRINKVILAHGAV